jgi:hypothetical protein
MDKRPRGSQTHNPRKASQPRSHSPKPQRASNFLNPSTRSAPLFPCTACQHAHQVRSRCLVYPSSLAPASPSTMLTRKVFPEISAIVRLTAGCQCAVLYIDKFDPDTTDIQVRSAHLPNHTRHTAVHWRTWASYKILGDIQLFFPVLSVTSTRKNSLTCIPNGCPSQFPSLSLYFSLVTHVAAPARRGLLSLPSRTSSRYRRRRKRMQSSVS